MQEVEGKVCGPSPRLLHLRIQKHPQRGLVFQGLEGLYCTHKMKIV